MSQPFLGEIRMVGFTFAPRGWAFCHGQILSIAQNTALFSLLGTTYGGNGTTTFALPNLGGRIPVGEGQSPGTSTHILGQMAGTENVTLTTAQMPAHDHSLAISGESINLAQQASSGNGTIAEPGPTAVPAKVASGLNALDAYSTDADTTLHPVTGTITGNTQLNGSSLPFDVMQPYTVINFVIALEGLFPSRN